MVALVMCLMQNGGLSIGYERMYGYGADNVLSFEMVLPDATHVKVFPSEWEQQPPPYIYPKTTKAG